MTHTWNTEWVNRLIPWPKIGMIHTSILIGGYNNKYTNVSDYIIFTAVLRTLYNHKQSWAIHNICYRTLVKTGIHLSRSNLWLR